MKTENLDAATGLCSFVASAFQTLVKMEENDPPAYKPKYLIHQADPIV